MQTDPTFSTAPSNQLKALAHTRRHAWRCPAEEGPMNEMVYVIALVRCVSGHCEFAYPAPDMPSASYQECLEKAKVFDFALANRYWTEVNCVELPKDKLAHFVMRGVGPR
jgi:hypothetical protein